MESYQELSDEQLIRKLREGDSKIMDFILDKYKPLVRKKSNAMYLIGGDTDDLIQEGMIGLFKGSSTRPAVGLSSAARIFSRVELDGRDLSAVRESDAAAFRRDNLGFVFQEFNLLDTFTLRDNIYLPLVLAGMGQCRTPVLPAW